MLFLCPWLSMVNGLSSIMIMVDHFSKYAMFIPTLGAHMMEIDADLFYQNIVKHFGLPSDIINDKDARFMERF